MTETLNESWMDALVRHQVGLARLGPAIGNRVNALLYQSEADLRSRVERGISTGMSPGRLKSTLKTLEMARGDAFDKAKNLWNQELRDAAINEPYFLDQTLHTLSPVELQSSLPNVRTLEAIATSTPFEGRVMSDWANRLQRSDYDRMVQAVQIGLTQGQTGKQIAARIFGTQSALGSDGALQVTRNNAQAISRTAVNAITGAARQKWVDENADIIEWEVFLATLDARTTLICASNDNHKYQRGKGPHPPLHWNCRSLRMPVFNGEVIGERPARPFTEKQLLREYAEKTGTKVVSSRDDLGKGSKGPYDAFARQRKRDLTGQVPAKVSFDEWLRKQSKEFQDEYLGPKRAQLFRDGMKLDKFVAQNGETITLNKLQGLDKKFTPKPYGEPRAPAPPIPDPEAERRIEAERRRVADAEAKRRAEEAERKRLAEQEAQRAQELALAKERQRIAQLEMEKMRKAQEEAERQLAEERRLRQIAQAKEREAVKALDAERAAGKKAGSLQELVKGIPFRFEGTQGQMDAVKRGLEKAGFGMPGQQKIAGGISVTREVGPIRWENNSMPQNMGGAMWNGDSPSQHKMRLNSHPDTAKAMIGDATERKFLVRTMQTGPGPNGALKHQLPFNTQAIAKNADEGLEVTTVHEYGHHVHLQGGSQSAINKMIKQAHAAGVDYVSNYARENAEEWFAESFAAYHYYPRSWMVKFAPKSLSIVERVLKEAKLELTPGRTWADIPEELKAGLNL